MSIQIERGHSVLLWYHIFIKYLIFGATAFFIYVLVSWISFLRSLPGVDTPIQTGSIRVSPAPVLGSEVYYYAVSPGQEISLIPNFLEHYLSTDVKNKRACEFLTNGGFYTKSDTPLGLFIVDGNQRAKQIQSGTFNGFFWKTGSKYSIANEHTDNPDWIMQSGPILLQNGNPTTLRIANDNPERRTVAAINTSGIPVFLSTISELAELPTVIAGINKKKNLQLVSAINLDGGTSSVFLSPDTSLVELKPVGSFFCVK